MPVTNAKGLSLSDATPQAVDVVGSAGTGAEAARADHTHLGYIRPMLHLDGYAGYVLPGWENQLSFGTSQLSPDELYSVPIYVALPTSYTKMMCRVTTAGAAGKVIRMGIYTAKKKAGVGIEPDALLLDAGTVAADSTSYKELAVALALVPGFYFLVCISDGSPVLESLSSSETAAPVSGMAEAGAPTGIMRMVAYFKSGQVGVAVGGLATPHPNPGGHYPAYKVGQVRLKMLGVW